MGQKKEARSLRSNLELWFRVVVTTDSCQKEYYQSRLDVHNSRMKAAVENHLKDMVRRTDEMKENGDVIGQARAMVKSIVPVNYSDWEDIAEKIVDFPIFRPMIIIGKSMLDDKIGK